MSQQVFCTQCGTGLAPAAKFCTSCGTGSDGTPAAPKRGGAPAAGRAAASHPPARPHVTPAAVASSPAAIVAAVLLLAAGGGAAWLSLGTKEVPQRAVAGSPSAPGGGMGQAAAEGLPSGHPNIELPEEVKNFLKGLADEAEKNPTNVEAWQKLTRARYRASVINPSWKAPAAAALKKLLELEPENMEGLRIAANLSYDAADFPEAQKRFEKFLEKNPDDASALTDLGSTLLFQDQIDGAIAQYGLALSKDPKFMQAHFNMGIALEKMDKTPEAIASLKKAFELAESPDQKQHIENAVAELEKREPKVIEGAAPPLPAPGDASAGSPGSAPGGMAPPSGAAAGMGTAAVTTPPRPPATMAPAGGGGVAPAGGGGVAPPAGGGMGMPPPAPERDVPNNATTDFHRAVQKNLIVHPIVGPRVTAFEWTGPSSGRVKIANFPMDQMPPFAKAKFESVMNEKLATAAKANAVDGAISLEFVDDPSGRVMDTLSGAAAPAAGAPAGMP